MLFSEDRKATKGVQDDWFDPIVEYDTKLFIDPFLIFSSSHPFFEDAQDKVVNFFNYAFELVARSGGDKTSVYYKKALAHLRFPEAKEICLGFASSSTNGAGSSSHYSADMVDAVWSSIKAGIKHIDHFEELSIFNEGIGPDRISDITANLLKPNLVAYTQDICGRHNIEMSRSRTRRYDESTKVWISEEVQLPISEAVKKTVILVPEKYLRKLPTINPDDFYDYMSRFESRVLRDEFSFHLKSKINKKQIVDIARAHLDSVERYVEHRKKKGSTPYDLKSDPSLEYRWQEYGNKIAEDSPVKIVPPTSGTEFNDSVEKIIGGFKHFVELMRGYELLWNKSISKSEGAVQRLFHGVAYSYCADNGIVLSKEPNNGMGPVDFKFSNGYSNRAILEVKLARNSKFWHGLKTQTPIYMASEGVKNGYFLVVAYTNKDMARIKDISECVAEVNKRESLSIKCIVVDARRKPSASKAVPVEE